MLLNSSKPPQETPEDKEGQGSVSTPRPTLKARALRLPERPVHPTPMKRRILFALGLPAWVFLGFMLAQALIIGLMLGLQELGVTFSEVNASVFNASATTVVYTLAIILVIGVPWWIKRRATTREELGIQRWPKWTDLLWTPVGMIVYLILTLIISTTAVMLLPFVDAAEPQDVGFEVVSSQLEYIIAFLTLVVIAPIAEEVLFRGYLLGKLRKYTPLWGAILITSLLFAVVHFQWNVGFDTFALSIVLCLLRVVTRGLWAPILLHMLKNGVAYYFLFINPSLLSTLGG